MLTELSLSGFLAFAMAYPLCFLATPAPPSTAVSTVSTSGWPASFSASACSPCCLPGRGPGRAAPGRCLPPCCRCWPECGLLALLAVTWSQWERPRPNLLLVALPSVLGAAVTAATAVARTPAAAAPFGAAALTLLGGLTLGMALYCMVLGHGI